MDLTAALKWLNSAVISSTGNKLREPERVILKGTWRGLTYEQMADGSEYSTNYLMRDVAPKLWKQLSNVFGRSVGKTNFRVALEAYAAANAAVGFELQGTESLSGLATNGIVGELPINEPNQAARNALYPKESIRGRYWPNQVTDGSFKSGANRLETNEPFSKEQAASPRFDFATTFRNRLKTPLYGYERELEKAVSWLAHDKSPADKSSDESSASEPKESAVRLIGIWGLTGIGKSMLAERLLCEVSKSFDQVVVRSLQDQPLLSELCVSILAELGFSSQLEQAVAYLQAVMARQSVLLLLEDIEAILTPGQLAGSYLENYRGYEDFFAGASGASGCVVITGIEGPTGLVRQGDATEDERGDWVRSLPLSGLSLAAASELLQQESLSVQPASTAVWEELIQRYQGHPLAIKAAARVIREIFDGRVDEFLTQMSVLFTDVLRLLLPSFSRLSKIELNILYWLASQDNPLSLAELKSTLPIALRPSELISALDSLKQRSLLVVQRHSRSTALEAGPSVTPLTQPNDKSHEGRLNDKAGTPSISPTFSLPALVKAYAIYQFVGQFGDTPETASSGSAYGTASQFLEPPAINLGAQSRSPIRLSQWFEGQFDTRWQPLESLFAAVTRPAIRLRSAYRFQDKTFVKRCKSVVLSAPANESAQTSAILLLAIHQDSENLYKICMQAQPPTEDTVLPEGMELRLLDAQGTVLASVSAQQADSFIQLPYFQGAIDESFEIALALETAEYRERFAI